MEMKHPGMIFVGICIIGIITIFSLVIKKRKKKFDKGVKIASDYLWESDSYFKRRVRKYRRWSAMLFLGLFVAILGCSILLARPYETKEIREEKHNRDIILCMDVSTSVNALNASLMKHMQEMVAELEGERIGIVIFNTSPVLVTPLTDDYQYVIEQLKNIEKSLECELSLLDYGESDDGETMDFYESLYWQNYIISGTLIGNQERGSSLVGDGLASCVFDFSDLDTKRTRIVILSTDNETNGEQYATLNEAASLCKSKGIIVYGIGTKDMYSTDLWEMEDQVKKTGGKFYLEEESGTYKEIVDDIGKQSKSKIKDKLVYKEIEQPGTGFLILLIGATGMFLAAKITKR